MLEVYPRVLKFGTGGMVAISTSTAPLSLNFQAPLAGLALVGPVPHGEIKLCSHMVGSNQSPVQPHGNGPEGPDYSQLQLQSVESGTQ